jgi:hypothetical protein
MTRYTQISPNALAIKQNVVLTTWPFDQQQPLRKTPAAEEAINIAALIVRRRPPQ